MYILGINAYHGDAAAALIKDGRIVAAVEEERFNRIKHCAGFPTEAVRYCLQAAGIGIEAVDHVGISRDPSAHLHKKVLFAARRAAKGIVGGSPREISTIASHGVKAVGSEHSVEAIAEENADGTSEHQGNGSPREISSNAPHGVKAVGSEQNAETIGEEDADRMSALPAGSVPALQADRNGNGRGILRQIRNRLNNAAKVRDLPKELARALGVSGSKLRAQFHNIEHHRAHLASSFFVSPFERAALLSIDGFGDFISTMWARGVGNSIEILGQVEYPHSTGIVYTATTQFLGFPHYGDEGKVMGLAPHGTPRFIEQFRDIIRTEGDGKFSLNLDYFRHHAEGVDMTWDNGSPRIGRIFSDEYARTFGAPRREGEPLTDRDRDVAASLQLRLEEVAFHVLNHLHEQTGLTDLGLSGGVAYNSVMNGKILLNTPFRRVFVQPAAGDSGTALGVCYQIWNDEIRFRVSSSEFRVGKNSHGGTETRRRSGQKEFELMSEGSEELETRNSKLETRYVMEGAYTGPEFSDAEMIKELQTSNLKFETYSDVELTRHAARDIADGLVVGWFQGRMEFGPRALGNRSIVVDPRRAEMKDVLNTRIKKRESFRPFAPSILEEYVGDYFEQTHPAPTMLMVYQVKPEQRARIPAVTHVDGSGRLQTVSRAANPRYHQLIQDFHELSGVPVVLNTSFNENEPIVCTPREAIDCFVKTRMDALYLGNHAVRRKNQESEN